MPKYVIEREIPGAGNFTAKDLREISLKSCGVLDELGTSIQWIRSFVTAELNAATPEALMYEPQKNGTLRLVGVEFIAAAQGALALDGA